MSFQQFVRPARIAVLTASMAVAGLAAPFTMHTSAAPSMPGCPSTEEIVGGFSKGLGYLVEDGSLSKADARDARSQFAAWANDEKGLGCAVRDGMMKNGAEMMAFLGMTPQEMKDAYKGGQSLVEMAAANGHSEAELVGFLEGLVDEGLDAFVAAGAFDGVVRDAIDAKAEEHITWGVDYQKGDAVPDHHAD